ncbi:MAG TPA: UDP-3-O-acyl-N-acetylglucosamine deacetylase [Gemmatimonadales bacterium]|jgi:UDP-3-O-acyl N-acetylglucosamine deacetylase|nr:UDP-3-O-acyl-N-acetylglucosamine deacetylase [Gemmatimonadales bacterium]
MARRTIADPAELSGIGLHTGAMVQVRFAPGEPGQGIVIRRVDRRPPVAIAARAAAVAASERRTRLEHGGVEVETVEHCLAAAHALELDDLTVDLDGPELPILDGSFAPFLEALDGAGVMEQPGEPRTIAVSRRLDLREAGASYTVEPADALALDVTLAHPHPRIGVQQWRGHPVGDTFRHAIAGARTWGLLREVEIFRARGLLRGASPACAIVLSEDDVIGPPLRWPDEFVRHKAGDLLGDLALAGGRLQVRITARQPNHRGNLACARAILEAARLAEDR